MDRLNNNFINFLLAIKEAEKKNLTSQQQVVINQIKETVSTTIFNTRVILNDFIATCDEESSNEK